MVSHKVQLLASLLLISEVYTQCTCRYGNGYQQVGRPNAPAKGQFIIPAIIKPCPSCPTSAPYHPLNTPKLTNDVIVDRLIRLLICDIIEKDNVGLYVEVKEGKKNVDAKEGKKNVDEKEGKKNVEEKEGKKNVDEKEGKKNIDEKEGKKNVDVKEEGQKNDGTCESKEPEICVVIRPYNC